MTSGKAVLSAAVLLLAFVPLARAQGTYTQIDYPGAVGTTAWGVSSKGDIVGSYVDAQSVSNGFLLSGGTYTTINFPGGTFTTATGVNRSGQIVGVYEPSANSPFVGFFMDSTGFTSVDYLGSFQTEMTGINDSGVAVGYYTEVNGFSAGFKWLAGTFKEVRAPSGAVTVLVFGINNLGDMAAGESRETGFWSFLVTTKGTFIPITFAKAHRLVASGVNDTGEVVGTYQEAFESLGFVLRVGTVTSLSFPNSTQTNAMAINNSAEVVGFFKDTSGTLHGFTWTPPAAAGKK